VDQPKLEVSLQEANPDSGDQPPKSEGDTAAAFAADLAVPSGHPAPRAESPLHVDSSLGLSTGFEELEKPSLGARLRGLFGELCESLFSSDAPTRRTALLFFLGLVGVGLVSIASVQRIHTVRVQRALEQKQRQLEEKRLAQIEQSRLEDLKVSENVVGLGRYVVSLKPIGKPVGTKSSSDPLTADFELFIRCNDKEVREYIEARSVQVRSELTSALVGMSREDFLAVDGKRRTHKKILLTLNQWLAREYSGARIEDAWFSDLVVE